MPSSFRRWSSSAELSCASFAANALVPLAQRAVAGLDLALAPVELVELAGQLLFLLDHAALDLLDLLLARARLLLELAARLERRLLGLELGGADAGLALADLGFGLRARLLHGALAVVEDALGASLGVAERAGDGELVPHVADEECEEGDERNQDDQDELDVHCYLQTGDNPGPIRTIRTFANSEKPSKV